MEWTGVECGVCWVTRTLGHIKYLLSWNEHINYRCIPLTNSQYGKVQNLLIFCLMEWELGVHP